MRFKTIFLLALSLTSCRSPDLSSSHASDLHDAQGQRGVYQISSLDFSAPSEDLHPISMIVDEARIVALGESIHTNGTFHKANARAARSLIEKEGFRELALETPWQWASVLSDYTRDCSNNAIPLEGLKRIFPQFASMELSALYEWVRDFNCGHSQDQVRVYGFDVQQIAFMPSESRHDEASLDTFVSDHVPSLVPRIADLRLCGPKDPSDHTTPPKNDEELSKCHAFLSDLQPFITEENPDAFKLRASIIALHYSAGSDRHRSDEDSAANNAWRDEGMAKMIQYLKSPAKRTVVIAHNGHVFHEGQIAIPFAKKTMGSFLDDIYGSQYRVIACESFKVTKSGWWRNSNQGGEDVYQPGSDSFEGRMNSLNRGNLVLNAKANSIFASGTKIEINGMPDVEFQRHMDGVFFFPETMPMTNVPGVNY
ncbi:MAG: erythromycin esterase family protein [Proteobacteria bacterium]|nr:erythromycin esterase family protein [Pseudomonadota bacterium]